MIRVLSAAIFIWGIAAFSAALVHELAYNPLPSEVTILLPESTCKSPCWQGIRPGVTTPKQANEILAGSNLWVKSNSGSWQLTLSHGAHLLNVNTEELEFLPANLEVGDVLAALGQPDYQEFIIAYSGRQAGQIALRLYYEPEQLFFEVKITDGSRMTPASPITRILYKHYARPQYAKHWHGCEWVSELAEFTGTFR